MPDFLDAPVWLYATFLALAAFVIALSWRLVRRVSSSTVSVSKAASVRLGFAALWPSLDNYGEFRGFCDDDIPRSLEGYQSLWEPTRVVADKLGEAFVEVPFEPKLMDKWCRQSFGKVDHEARAAYAYHLARMDIETAADETRIVMIKTFRDHLTSPEKFSIRKTDGFLVLCSSKCAFHFVFDRRSVSKYVLLVSEPRNLKNGMSFVVLRHLVGARSLGNDESPVGLAKIVNRYFSMLLDGDFSIRRRYAELENRILNGFQASQRLSSDDPIKRKMKDCDLSWLDDIEARFRN